MSSASSLSSNPDWSSPVPAPLEIRNGRAVIDMERESENGQMPPALYTAEPPT